MMVLLFFDVQHTSDDTVSIKGQGFVMSKINWEHNSCVNASEV